MSYQSRCRKVLGESTVQQMVDSLLGEEKECDKDCDCKKCKMKALRDKKGGKKKGNPHY